MDVGRNKPKCSEKGLCKYQLVCHEIKCPGSELGLLFEKSLLIRINIMVYALSELQLALVRRKRF
jgi:hypothetical protein